MPSNAQLCNTVKQEDSYGQTRNLVNNWSIGTDVRKEDYNYCTTELPPAVAPGSQGTFALGQPPASDRPVVPLCCPLEGVGTATLSPVDSKGKERE